MSVHYSLEGGVNIMRSRSHTDCLTLTICWGVNSCGLSIIWKMRTDQYEIVAETIAQVITIKTEKERKSQIHLFIPGSDERCHSGRGCVMKSWV